MACLRSAIRSWFKFCRLAWSERWLLFQALFLLTVTAVSLRLLGFRRWQAVLARFTPARGVSASRPADALVQQGCAAARIMKMAAARGPCRTNCLQQSLVLWWLLRRRGIDADLRIGVRKEAGQFEAHAWVELAGVVLSDDMDVYQRFTPFNRIIRPSWWGFS